MSSDWGQVGRISVNSYSVSSSAATTVSDNIETYFGDDPDYSAGYVETVVSSAADSIKDLSQPFVEMIEERLEARYKLNAELFDAVMSPGVDVAKNIPWSKMGTNAAWVFGKDAMLSGIQWLFEEKPTDSVSMFFFSTICCAILKGSLADKDGGAAFLGEFGKTSLSTLGKISMPAQMSLFKRFNPIESISPKGLEQLAGKAKSWKSIATTSEVKDKVTGQMVTMAGTISVGTIASHLAVATGVDWLASMASNTIIALATGKEINVSTVKPGSSFLKSSTKIICAAAGEMIGGKAGKLVGTYVGMAIGDAQVKAFTTYDENGNAVVNEGWCAAAGAVQIATAVGTVALYAFLCSNPIGWVTGLVLLTGAAIGFAVTKIAYELCQIDWAAVGQEIGDAVVSTVNFVCAVGEEILEFAGEVYEATVDLVCDVIEVAENFVETACEVVTGAIETAVDYVENVVDYVQDLVGNIPVVKFLFGW